jgi:hypothetical protein
MSLFTSVTTIPRSSVMFALSLAFHYFNQSYIWENQEERRLAVQVILSRRAARETNFQSGVRMLPGALSNSRQKPGTEGKNLILSHTASLIDLFSSHLGTDSLIRVALRATYESTLPVLYNCRLSYCPAA